MCIMVVFRSRWRLHKSGLLIEFYAQFLVEKLREDST